ncbi:MAG: nitroreductase family protein [Bacteroidales bacterium]|nr:nitroreductase family protein [Bacteroidales bacterium]
MTFPDDQQLLAAIPARHSVRHFTMKKPEDEILDCLRKEVDRINATYGLDFSVADNEPTAFGSFMAHYGKFSNVRNYIVVNGPDGKEISRRCGYEGERLVLGLQAMGLNTCWVGMTYRKSTDALRKRPGEKVRCVIAFGYGADNGKEHRIKTIDKVSNCTGTSPEWFRRGVEAALRAPSAINQQKYFFNLEDNGSITARERPSLAGYTHIDLGIAVCHFNLAAGYGHMIDL